MIIRAEKRHVVYVASVCGILNGGGKGSSGYTFPKLQNTQLHPSSPSPPPPSGRSHAVRSTAPQSGALRQRAEHTPRFPGRAAHPLGQAPGPAPGRGQPGRWLSRPAPSPRRRTRDHVATLTAAARGHQGLPSLGTHLARPWCRTSAVLQHLRPPARPSCRPRVTL